MLWKGGMRDAVAKIARFVTRAAPRVRRPCVVMDFDDTMVYQHPVTQAVAANPACLAMWRMCDQLRVERYVVTARSKTRASYDYLMRQLLRAGYTLPDGLFMVCKGGARAYHEDPNPGYFKRDVRRMLTNRGCTVLASFGDQFTDLCCPASDNEKCIADIEAWQRDGACDRAAIVRLPAAFAALGVKLPALY